MLEVRAFSPDDIIDFQPQPAQRAYGDWRDMVLAAASCGPAWSGRWHGRMVGAAGVAMAWPGRGNAWCILADHIPPAAWIGLHRAAKRGLAGMLGPNALFRRIEAEAATAFDPGRRWLRMLGFDRECTARGYGPAGEDFERYAMVRPWN